MELSIRETGSLLGGVESQVIDTAASKETLVFASHSQLHDTLCKAQVLRIVWIAPGTGECGPDDRLTDDMLAQARGNICPIVG